MGGTRRRPKKINFLHRSFVRVRSGFLVTCGGFGPSQPSHRDWHLCTCGCPAGTHGYDPVSRMRLDQKRQPCCCVVGSRVACCEIFVETWSFRTLVFTFPHPSSARSCYELADSGIDTGTRPPRSHRHSSVFDVHRHLTSTLRSCWVRCHAAIVVLTTSVARHHRLHWHVNNLVVRTGPVESLARSFFGHVHVLATESQGCQVDSSCFDHSPVDLKSRQGWAWQRYLDQFDTLVIQQLDSVMTTNSSVLILCHTSHSDS